MTFGRTRRWLREEIRMHLWAARLAEINREDWAGLRYVAGTLRDRRGKFAALDRQVTP